MDQFPQPLQALIRELSRLPSIGEKSATRLAYFLISHGRANAPALADAIRRAAAEIKLCERCFFLTEENLCLICRNPNRDSSLVCVVEKPMDVVAMERVGEYRGVYHVLHGIWSPLRGQGPEDIKIHELVNRVKQGEIKEAILATSSTVEGDATALYIARLLNELNISVTRLAQGMPKGGELEYADDVTLSRALSGRSRISL